jgi:arylsulfatase A-like enzyme
LLGSRAISPIALLVLLFVDAARPTVKICAMIEPLLYRLTTRREAIVGVCALLCVVIHLSTACCVRGEKKSLLSESRPNIVLIITDDQGYGELACHGNPTIDTPNLDRLHAESTRLTAFHVSPTCAPTRASIMTGQHEFRSGVTHTIMQRERLALDATTIAKVLTTAGYQTGIFGKWHLGDEKPYRPAQRGFSESFIHGAGGIGQSYPGSCGDFPNNSYFDPYVLHNERVEKTSGYCTDVFFTQAMQWIETNRERPFFAQIATNAPHAPLVCPPKFQEPYEQASMNKDSAAYYGMITNIDENIGRLLAKLHQLGLENRTLVIFMTDNGHTHSELFNAGMRGKKGTPYEGGTRVPAFFRWPGTLQAGANVGALSGAIDLFPTLAELVGASIPSDVKLDGRSLVPLLQDRNANWSDRYLFTHLGRWDKGQAANSKFKQCAVRSQRFRLVNNQELYDIVNDPGEQRNVIDQHPQVVAAMRSAYDEWWDAVQPALINEDVPFAAENAFATLYREQVTDQ